jgi:hypothetical protein
MAVPSRLRGLPLTSLSPIFCPKPGAAPLLAFFARKIWNITSAEKERRPHRKKLGRKPLIKSRRKRGLPAPKPRRTRLWKGLWNF